MNQFKATNQTNITTMDISQCSNQEWQQSFKQN